MQDAGSVRSEVDLAAYGRRIGFSGALKPTLDTLKQLIVRHVDRIPFENVDVLLGKGVDIAPAAIDRKLLQDGRGGYCYEHGGLFKRVLRSAGFAVESIAARVRWGAPEGRTLARTHMALLVTLDDQRWLVDVGFGGLVPTAPLSITHEGPQATSHEAFRIVREAGIYFLQASLNDVWTNIYEFSGDPLQDIDYEPLNWFNSTSPKSAFRNNLMLARTSADKRYGLKNGVLSIRANDGTMSRREVSSADLPEVFDLFSLQFQEAWREPLGKFLRVE